MISIRSIQAGQFISYIIIQVFIQTNLYNYYSVEQFIGRNRSDNGIKLLFFWFYGLAFEALHDELRNNYYSQLQDTEIKHCFVQKRINRKH